MSRLLDELRLLIKPIVQAAESDEARRELLHAIGWDLESLTGTSEEAVTAQVDLIAAAFAGIEARLSGGISSITEFLEVLDLVDGVFESVRMLGGAARAAATTPPPELDQLGIDLLSFLTNLYIAIRAPLLHALLVLLTLLEPDYETLDPPVLDGEGRAVRAPRQRMRWRAGRARELLEDPTGTLRAEYAPNGLATRDDADHTADKLFPRLARLLAVLGAEVVYGIKPAYELGYTERASRQLAHALTILFGPGGERLGVTLMLDSAEDGDLGVVVAPFGSLEQIHRLCIWDLAIEFGGSLEAFAVGPQGVALLDALEGAVKGRVALVSVPAAKEQSPSFVLGSDSGPRVEVGRVEVALELDASSGESATAISASAIDTAIIIDSADADSFVRAVVPPGGLRADVDLGAGWSSRTGVFLRGSGTLEATWPVHAAFAGVSLEAVRLALQVDGDGADAETTALVSGTLGPLTVVVDGLGLRWGLRGRAGNLGVGQLDVEPVVPRGIGLSIDAGPVHGGGFLAKDPIGYRGALELEIFEVGLKAFGVIDTELPEGGPSYSAIAVIAGEFPGVPLGFGFELDGAGGLVGIHRRADTDAIRRRLREGGLPPILFPQGPLSELAGLTADLRALFPPADDRYLFGPTARIRWGPDALLRAELGLFLELPAPIRALLLGTVHLWLPRQDLALLEIHLDVAGELDIGRRFLALDARLRDSKVIGFSILGEAAARLSWAEDATFALSIGGFHPDYRPPPGFPKLQPITVPIGLDDNPRVTLKGYLAVTSNTLQIGASADLYASAGWFSITGGVDFAALFQFSPFAFVADFSGRVTLRKNETDLAGVSLEATISGPSPWRAAGKACLVLKWLPDPCVGFDANFGRERRESVEPIEPWPLLRSAVEHPASYSSSSGERRGATLASPDAVLDPGAGLTFRQSLMPLNRTLSKLGLGAPAGGPVRFEIESVAIGGRSVGWRAVTDKFAPAQYADLDVDEKLSRPSFEPMDAGFTAAGEALGHGNGLARSIEYEERIVDSWFAAPRARIYVPEAEVVSLGVAGGSAARSPLRTTAGQRFQPIVAPVAPVSLNEELYVVASTLDLGKRADITAPTTKGAALEALAEYLAQHPGELGQLEVMSTDELV